MNRPDPQKEDSGHDERPATNGDPTMQITRSVTTLMMIAMALLASCKSTSVSATGEVQVTATAALQLEGKQTGFLLASAAGTFTRDSLVSLTEGSQPVPWAREHADTRGMVISPREVTLRLNHTHLAADARLELTLPVPAPGYDRLGTMVFLAHAADAVVPLQHVGLAADGRLTVELTRADFKALTKLAELPADSAATFSLFAAGLPEVDKLDRTYCHCWKPAALYRYQPSSECPPELCSYKNWKQHSCDQLAGKRVALLVHGLTGNPSNWDCLAPWLHQEYVVNNHYYDEIWAFGYPSIFRLKEMGTKMAEMASSCFGEAEGVDIFAHSMGNPISRYAMEKGALGNLRLSTEKYHHYVSIAGIHEGTPFRVIQSWLWYLPRLGCTRESTKDLLTDCIPKDGRFPTSYPNDFLKDLNANKSPDVTTSRYYTLGGINHDLVIGTRNIGKQTQLLYSLLEYWCHFLPSHRRNSYIAQDGLAAQYCAQAREHVLDTKSSFYANSHGQATAMFNLTHFSIIGIGSGKAKKCTTPCLNTGPSYKEFGKLQTQLKTWIDSWI